MKLPALLGHFLEHVEDHNDLSFAQFIHEHYDHQGQCNKSDDHCELPFKDPHCCVSLSVCAVLPVITEFSFSQISDSHEVGHKYLMQFVTGALDVIWQPPG